MVKIVKIFGNMMALSESTDPAMRAKTAPTVKQINESRICNDTGRFLKHKILGQFKLSINQL